MTAPAYHPESEAGLLLGQSDPTPFEVVNPDSTYPAVLVCEHAGRVIPNALGDMGLSDAARQAHIAWDIGAEAVSRLVAAQLGACLILQRYSRLVIDCNRPPDSETAMPVISDETPVPANLALTTEQKSRRVQEIFDPFQAVVDAQILKPSCTAAFSIHSFTRSMAGQYRPWEIGFLFRKDSQTSLDLADTFAAYLSRDRIGLNEPYTIDDESDWFVPRHGEAKGRAHSLIEICNDQIDTPQGQTQWAAWLSTAIAQFLQKDPR
ncbi:N-formylglutamate amidohydrolase [Roseobacter sp. N2S]|uniref:N-formylglutamate amidohydrolase n=1 Tax=Roseobacter sp. N2S TaxID=2663844 RepID=UPI0028582528|nr:N-formylglutamate amidohydrolase [Roseobacter sp. N2S]MDR6265877.1 putative N-formylglutamate amidohydrolase [Roseobacter sp. N2S]